MHVVVYTQRALCLLLRAGGSLTFEQLLTDSGLERIHAPVAMRARIRYGHLVTLAIMERKPSLAREAYELAKVLPSTATAEGLRMAGYKLNGMMHEGSELIICYKGEQMHLLKGLHEDEAARARIFHDACAGEAVPHVTP
jgi:hypothetical protein